MSAITTDDHNTASAETATSAPATTAARRDAEGTRSRHSRNVNGAVHDPASTLTAWAAHACGPTTHIRLAEIRGYPLGQKKGVAGHCPCGNAAARVLACSR